MTMTNDATFTARVAAAIDGHAHPDDAVMREHPGYEPYVKIVCRVCPAETYVRRTALPAVVDDDGCGCCAAAGVEYGTCGCDCHDDVPRCSHGSTDVERCAEGGHDQ